MNFNAGRSTILIIAGSLSDQHSVIELFEEEHFTVITVPNMEQGMLETQGDIPDLVLIDDSLLDSDGFEICRCLKANNDDWQAIPVIFIVEKESTDYMTRCIEAGGVDYVVKSLHREALVARVNTQLKLSRLEQQNEQLERRLADFSEQKLALKESERLYFSLLENHPDGIVRLDPQGRNIYISQSALEKTGTAFSAEALLGKTVCELPIPGNPELMQPLLDAVLKVVATAKVENIEFTWRNGNISELCFIPELNERGEVSSVLSIARDITEKQHIALKLEDREREYRTLLENSSDCIIRYDRDCRVVYLNPKLEAVTELSKEEIIGKTPKEAWPDGRYDELQNKIELAIKTGDEIDEFVLPAEGDDQRYHHLRLMPERDKQGNVYGLIIFGRDVSELKLAQAQLEQEKNTLNTLFNTIPDMVWTKDLEGRFIACNPVVEELFGIKKEAIIGKRDADFFDAELADYVVKKDKEALAAGVPTKNEEWLTFASDGKARLMETTKTPVIDAAGNITGVLGIAHDITALKESEDQLRAVLDNQPDVIIRYDKNLQRLYVNPQYEKVSGRFSSEVLGKALLGNSNKFASVATGYIENLKGVFATGQQAHFERDWNESENIRHCYDIRMIPEHNAAGEVVSVITVCRDILDRKKMEEEIIYRENQFRTLAQNSPNIIIRYDRSLSRIYANPSYMKENGIGYLENVNDVSPQRQAAFDEYNATLQRVIDSGEPSEFVFECPINAEQQTMSYAINMIAEWDTDGQVLGALVIAHDITEIKNIEKRLAQSHEQLRGLTARLVTAKEDRTKSLARDLHDELGQYLTALRMGIGVLRMRSEKNDPVILDQANDLSKLIDHIILVMRDVAARMRPTALDMGIISALEWLANDFIKRTNIVCKLNVNKDDIVLDDNYATAIFRMVQESLTNIIRHAQAKQVEISFIDYGNHYVLKVTDDGIGFDSSIIKPKSFGLTGIRERALMLRGELDIISKPNCGTTISVTIPTDNIKRAI